MKKKILGILGVVTLLFSLTGCIKFNATMDIKEDKSMDFEIIYAINKSMLEMNEEEQEEGMTEEERQSIIDKGFSITDYEDDNNKGYKLTKHISNIDEYSSDGDIEYSISGIFEGDSDEKMFKVVKGVDKNKYVANFKFESDNSSMVEDNESDTATNEIETSESDVEINASEETDMEDLSKMNDAMAASLDLKFTVKLPYAAISDNATSKSEDKRELTWKLNANQTENIKFEFELNNNINANKTANATDNSMIIAIAVLAFGFILFIISIIVASKKKKNK